MTKKEQKQMEAVQRQKLQLRRNFLDALRNYHEDISAITRVNGINGVHNAPDLKEQNLKRYPVLSENGYMVRFPVSHNDINSYEHFIWAMETTDKEYRFGDRKKFERPLKDDELWVQNDIFSDIELCNFIRFMKKFGYNKMVFTDRSCSATETLTTMVEMGAKFIDVNRYIEYSYRVGIVIDITSVDLAGWICFHKIPELKEDEIGNRKMIEVFTKLYELFK